MELFLASFLHGRQLSGHIMYGFNKRFSSAEIVAVGLWCWVTFRAGVPTNGRTRVTVLVVGAGGAVRIFLLSAIISLFFLPSSGMNR